MDWGQFKGATCLPDCWCEAPRLGSWILEPVNTWTNLAFIFLGIFFIIRSLKFQTNHNILNSSTLYPKVYGWACIILGIGSFFYHASQTLIGQTLDVLGMYLVSVFYIVYNLVRSKKIHENQFLPIYIVIVSILGFIIYYIPETRRYMFALTLVITLIQSILIQKKSSTKIQVSYLYGSLLIYLVAQFIWILDKNRIWCDPYGFINGHGIWHILTAISAYFAYMFFNSEKKS